MAYIQLATLDTILTTSEDTTCSWMTSKIGGRPNWMHALHHPNCKLCGNALLLIAQVYCPLVTSFDHRTIYIFACSNKECWNESESWLAIRSQVPAIKKRSKDDITEVKQPTNSTWDCPGCDDWDDDIIDENEDSYKECFNKKTDLMESITEATHRISMDDAGIGVGDVPCFISVALSIFDEPSNPNEKPFQYENTLLQRYERKYGTITADSNDNQGKNETYEKVTSRHGDRVFDKFVKRLQRCPEQVLRYCRGGSPLMLTPEQVDLQIPNCPWCGASRVYELQLMPTLVYQLMEINRSSTSLLEFGTVFVYTCSEDCWENDNPYRDEFLYLQYDPHDKDLPH